MSRRSTKAQRVEAARVLWVQSRSEAEARAGNGAHLADPANREQAAQAYREALRRLHLPIHSGLGDVRGQVYAAAGVLGLTEDDLRSK